MITFFAVVVIAAIIMLTFLLLAGWLINRPDTGRRAKPTAEDQRTVTAWLAGRHGRPLSTEDQRTVNWAKALNPRNVSRPGTTSGPPPEIPPAGPGHHHVQREAGPATPPRGTCGQPESGTNGGLPLHQREACEPCTVHGCGSGCRCACHWGEHTADLTALLPASDHARTVLHDQGTGTDDLIARAGRVLAGAACA